MRKEYLLIIALLGIILVSAISCSDKKSNDQSGTTNKEKPKNEVSASENIPSSALDEGHNEADSLSNPQTTKGKKAFEHRVVMTGYSEADFNEHYDSRIEPPALDLNQKLENKSIAELFVLKSIIPAMKGKIFENGVLSSFFENQSWYQPPFWVEDFEVELTETEQSFISKVDAELEKRKSITADKEQPNTDDLVNSFQFEFASEATMARISDIGFLIRESESLQPFDIYRENIADQIPAFITTDLILYQLHLLNGAVENEIEANKLATLLESMLTTINKELYSSYEKTTDPDVEKAIEKTLLYYAVPYSIVSNKKTNLIGEYSEIYLDELRKVSLAVETGSEGLDDEKFNYKIFKPYDHYKQSDEISRYYKASTWLQKVKLCLDNDDDFRQAMVVAYAINKNPSLKAQFKNFVDIKAYFSDQKRQFTLWDMALVVSKLQNVRLFEDHFKKEVLEKVRENLKIKVAGNCNYRVSLMPIDQQNQLNDLNSLINDDNALSSNIFFASIGNEAAKSLITDESGLDAINKNTNSVISRKNSRNRNWLDKLMPGMNNPNVSLQFNSSGWQKKQLNASMASWILLNERTYVRARSIKDEEKVENTEVKTIGFVEPNEAFWKSANASLQNLKNFLTANKTLSDATLEHISKLEQIITFLLSISEKENQNISLSEKEHRRINQIGQECHDLTLSLINSKFDPNEYMVGSSMAYASRIGRHDKTYQVAGVGRANEILVPVFIDGFAYLCKGAVFRYHEIDQFQRSFISRYQWKKILMSDKRPAYLPWMDSLVESNKTSAAPVASAK